MSNQDRLLSYSDLKRKGIPYSRQWLSALEKEGRFPRRFRVGAFVRWSENEVDAQVEAWKAEREAA
jgi:prophage regulatory protein